MLSHLNTLELIEYHWISILWMVIWVGIIDREKCGRKSAAEKVQQENYDRQSAVGKLCQK